MLKGYNFIILPNERTNRRRYLRTLITKNGGGFGKEIGLVDDSYIKSNNVINDAVFNNELDYTNEDLDCLQLFKLSSLSRWIKHGYLDFSQPLKKLHDEIIINNEELSDSKDFRDFNGTYRESSRDDVESLEISRTTSDRNPNEKLIYILKRLINRYQLQDDVFRSLAYKKMLHRLKNINQRIETEEQGIQHGLSKGFSRKIPLLLKLNNESELEMDFEEQTLLYFQECYGIGGKISRQFVDKGYKDFKDAITELNWIQMTGLAFYEDWQHRIPRLELIEHETIIRESLKKINSMMDMELMGSFRRGESNSGDIDIILYKKGENDMNYLSYQLEKLIKYLIEKNYIVCPLNLNSNLKHSFKPWFEKLSSHFKRNIVFGTSKEPLHKFYCGAQLCPRKDNDQKTIQLREKDKNYAMNNTYLCRRVDFLVCPWKTLGATKLYFTGSDEFNKNCRLWAKQMGYQLNNDGLYKDGKLIESQDEYKILEILGIGRILPNERNQLAMEIRNR